MTLEEFKSLPFKYVCGLNADDGAQRMYRNNEHGLQMEVHTKRKVRGDIYSGWKDGETAWFIDGDKREFKTVDDLYSAWQENQIAAKRREKMK